jgi:hypothetical protein
VSLKFRFVCATRESGESFLGSTALGRSLGPYLSIPGIELRLFAGNRRGLPQVYNEAIREAALNPAILIFIHDDVHLCDFFWPGHIANGLHAFDVIGLAGNKRRVPRQPSWYYLDDQFRRDASEHLSGVVAHGQGFPPESVSMYGAPCQEVKLLDGLLLATRSETLLSKGIEFDERFDFHFYDLDFCRQSEVKGVRLGTWTLSVIHQSGGSFNTPTWQAAYAKYLEKWQS